MAPGNETSETQAPVQKQIGGEQPGTTPAPLTPSSEAGAAAQEQLKTQEQITGEQLPPEVVEQLRQQLWAEHQSRADKQVAQRLRQYEETQAQQAEAKRLQALPGDQFKQAILQRQAVEQSQQLVMTQAEERISGMYRDVVDDVLSVVPDAKKREELKARSDATFGGFVKAVVEAAVEADKAKVREKLEQTERTAARKEARAEASGTPQLGSGTPSSNVDGLTASEKIRVGLELTQREARQ